MSRGRTPHERDCLQPRAFAANRTGVSSSALRRPAASSSRRADDPWILSGASVHISFIGQDDGSESTIELDGRPVARINANLTAGLDLTRARRLRSNSGIAFEGVKKGGPFEISPEVARRLLAFPNPDGRPNGNVVRPWTNGKDLYDGREQRWIVDFGIARPLSDAALYEAPFEYIARVVRPVHAGTARSRNWWIHERARPELRKALKGLPKYIATVRHSKHRNFTWVPAEVLPDSALVVVASADDFAFGVLQSRLHELWARATGTQVREVETGFRYTPTTCFETFAFPEPTDEQRAKVAAAGRRLLDLRDGWLAPPGLDSEAVSGRTLTNLYNERPTWLAHAHADLDAAVLDAYGWPRDLSDAEILERLLALNLQRAGGETTGPIAPR